MKFAADDELIIASHNDGKVAEIAALLAPYKIKVKGAAELGLDEPEETEPDFIGNARLKAEAATIATGLPALADDSGLCVAALDGAPGIYSARWAEDANGARSFSLAMDRVLQELATKETKDRSAYFVCALALSYKLDSNIITSTYEGRVCGNIAHCPSGELGFGYDPIFIPDGYDISFGEMEAVAKHKISHRAVAFEKFMAAHFV